MRLDDLLEKKEAKQLEILSVLMREGGTVSIKKVTELIDLSKTSIMTYIEDLQQVIVDRQIPCQLTIDKDKVMWQMAAKSRIEDLAKIYYQESLQVKILLHLLEHQEYTVVSLAQKLLISESTLARKIKELNQVLEEFHLTIWQGKLLGEELQIRYFYYLLCQHLAEVAFYEEKVILKNPRLVAIYERALAIELDEQAKIKLDRWITICKCRLSATQKDYTKIRDKMEFYQKDPLFQKIRLLIPRALAHYALSIDNEESMIQFVAMIAFQLYPEKALYQYSLERSRFTPTALVDTIVTEKVLRLYSYDRITPTIESALNLSFVPIHFQLFFLEGEISWRSIQEILQWEDQNTIQSYQVFAKQLLVGTLAELGIDMHSQTQLDMIELKYLSLIRQVNQSLTRIYRIGVSLHVEQVFKDAAISYFQTNLGRMTDVIVEPYDASEQYDLIVSNHSMNGKEHYRFSGIGTKYDFEQIYAQIKKHKKENETVI